MKKFLLILALFLIMVAIMGGYYNSYKDNAKKMQLLQETQERVQRTEALFNDTGWDAEKEDAPKAVLVPRKQLNEILRSQEEILRNQQKFIDGK